MSDATPRLENRLTPLLSFVSKLEKENQDASFHLMTGELLDGIDLRHVSIVPQCWNLDCFLKLLLGALKLSKKRMDLMLAVSSVAQQHFQFSFRALG